MVRLSRELRMIDIESRIPELKQYLGQNRDVVAAYLYGSYGTERQTVLSDVDLAILVRRGVHHDFRKRLGIQSDVVDVTGQEDINVVILNDLPLHIQHEILSTGRLLYERPSSDPANDEHTDFIEFVIKRYPDYFIDFEVFCREYDESLREAYRIGKQK